VQSGLKTLTAWCSGVTVLVLGSVLLPYAFPDIEVWWAPAVIAISAIAVLLAAKFPGALLPPVIFAGGLKSQATTGFSITDPMILGLAMLLFALAIHVPLAIGGFHRRSLWAVLRDTRRGTGAFFLFLFIVATSYLHTIAPLYGGQELTKFALIDSLLFIAPFILINSETQLKALAISCVVFSLLLIVKRSLVLTGHLYQQDITSIESGALFGMTIIMLLHYQPFEGRRARLISITLIILFALGTVASISRGAVFTLTVTAGISLVFGPRRTAVGSRKTALICMAIAAFAVVIAFSSIEMFAPHKFKSKEAELSNLASGTDLARNSSVGARFVYWKKDLTGFAEKPLLGWGLGASSVYLSGIDQRLYPHNLLIQIAMEQGIVGLSAFLFLLWSVLRFARIASLETGARFALLIWVPLVVTGISMTSGDLDDQRPMWLWFGIVFAGYSLARASCMSSQTSALRNLDGPYVTDLSKARPRFQEAR
jgi:O-antigen ligase